MSLSVKTNHLSDERSRFAAVLALARPLGRTSFHSSGSENCQDRKKLWKRKAFYAKFGSEDRNMICNQSQLHFRLFQAPSKIAQLSEITGRLIQFT